MTFTAPAYPRLALGLGLAFACGLGPVHLITAAHAQSTATTPATPNTAPATSPTTPAEVPAPASGSMSAGSAGAAAPATPTTHHRASQALNTYLSALHKDLKITQAEEPQWTAFADTMRDNASDLGQAYRARRAQLPSMTATQDLDSFIQVEQLRLDGLKKSSQAFAALYAAMPDDQKKVADSVFLSDLPGGPHRRGPAKAKPAQ